MRGGLDSENEQEAGVSEKWLFRDVAQRMYWEMMYEDVLLNWGYWEDGASIVVVRHLGMISVWEFGRLLFLFHYFIAMGPTLFGNIFWGEIKI